MTVTASHIFPNVRSMWAPFGTQHGKNACDRIFQKVGLNLDFARWAGRLNNAEAAAKAIRDGYAESNRVRKLKGF